MKLGIILIHGYSGSSHELQPLAAELMANFGADSVTNLTLPGHDSKKIPDFNADLFSETIKNSITRYQNEDRKIILIGHSTGGSLALSTLLRFSIIPDLLVLIAVPKKIDSGYFTRWEAHRTGKEKLLLIDIAMMVKLINSAGSSRFTTKFPVMLIHGESDQLVLCQESQAWNDDNFSGQARVVTIPQAGHDIFNSSNHHLVTDIVVRAVADLSNSDIADQKNIASLTQVEPGLTEFFKAAPFSESHLALSPSGQRVIGKKPSLQPIAQTDPVIANIEITTYCNLRCKFCARSHLKKRNKHMPFDLFANILALLPNTYKIVLVGLGEPLMHPHLIEFIKYAKSLKKKVGLVTNAMLLNPEVSSQLLKAGLDSIAFSIDGADMDLSALVRKGTDFTKVITNIKEFVKIADSAPTVSKAVFSAVSTDTVAHLKELVDRVADLGVDVLMLSDINFKTNLDHTLWQNQTEQIEDTVKKAISHAFSRSLPVLSVHGLEEFGIEQRYHDFLLIPPAQLYQRSPSQTWCYSPWQTVPVDVDGQITLCDCQPDVVLGNLFHNSFSAIWNGEPIKKHRAEMLSQQPPDACKICPRF